MYTTHMIKWTSGDCGVECWQIWCCLWRRGGAASTAAPAAATKDAGMTSVMTPVSKSSSSSSSSSSLSRTSPVCVQTANSSTAAAMTACELCKQRVQPAATDQSALESIDINIARQVNSFHDTHARVVRFLITVVWTSLVFLLLSSLLCSHSFSLRCTRHADGGVPLLLIGIWTSVGLFNWRINFFPHSETKILHVTSNSPSAIAFSFVCKLSWKLANNAVNSGVVKNWETNFCGLRSLALNRAPCAVDARLGRVRSWAAFSSGGYTLENALFRTLGMKNLKSVLSRLIAMVWCVVAICSGLIVTVAS